MMPTAHAAAGASSARVRSGSVLVSCAAPRGEEGIKVHDWQRRSSPHPRTACHALLPPSSSLCLLPPTPMKTLAVALSIVWLAAASTSAAAQTPNSADIARWEQEAQRVTIIRDNWGIAHVYGHTDADAVFGMIYAQSEDDFNRVETNYINAMGRLAEAEGERAIFRDLRMKLFISPDTLRAKYAASPAWLKTLMKAWADGLNYYLYTHPAVKPRVISHFEPWMALSFSEGSIGGDIERVNLGQLEAFYGTRGSVDGGARGTEDGDTEREMGVPNEPTGSNGVAIAP